jgi:hypothetical protein
MYVILTNAVMLSVIRLSFVPLSIIMLSFVLLNYNMLSVVLLNDFILSAIMLCVIELNVVAPQKSAIEKAFQIFQNIKTNSARLHLLDPGLR